MGSTQLCVHTKFVFGLKFGCDNKIEGVLSTLCKHRSVLHVLLVVGDIPVVGQLHSFADLQIQIESKGYLIDSNDLEWLLINQRGSW
jgi:hypothetical protein